MDNTCVCCGSVIPEGRMVCWACENRQGVSPERTNDMKETMNPLHAVLATGSADEAACGTIVLHYMPHELVGQYFEEVS